MDDLTDTEMLRLASAFDLIPFSPRGVPPDRLRELRVERRRIDPDAWAILSEGNAVLNRDGKWEYEPTPSSRDEAFFARCRWPSAREAIAFARTHLSRYPTGYKLD